jgi:hypothetical protein
MPGTASSSATDRAGLRTAHTGIAHAESDVGIVTARPRPDVTEREAGLGESRHRSFVERDPHFEPRKAHSAYADEAWALSKR